MDGAAHGKTGACSSRSSVSASRRKRMPLVDLCMLGGPAAERPRSPLHSSFVPSASVGKVQLEEVENQRAKSFPSLDYVHHVIGQVRCILGALQREQLPWIGDFFDTQQFVPPSTGWEALERINLNLPFYAANYAVIFHAVTLVFLLLYDKVFCAFIGVFALLLLLLRSVHFQNNERERAEPSKMMYSGGFCVGHKTLSGVYFISFFSLVLLDGLRTLAFVLLINSALIIPHAVWRRPMYFDDEELEKLRPKLVEYVIILLLRVMAYLECGGVGNEACKT